MDGERWNRLARLFEAAVDLDERERDEFLREQCAGDDALRAEVESLVQQDSAPTEYGDAIRRAAQRVDRGSVDAGELIGPYRLIRELGQGGMGSVWLAARDDDEYRQEVAIKILRSAYDKHIRSRFLAERQILANLSHPYIARLLDGGSTETGVPYVVMEFVEGKPIDRYCDQQRLSVSQRIELFRKVCRAVHYAHGRLVVHRDLKPANILVGVGGEPKLLDFGIAKLIDAGSNASDEGSHTTAHSLPLMTPHYASPEQIRGDTITTASDIYSLGVLLNKLLTGNFPYPLEKTDSLSIARAICDNEPRRPSANLSRVRASVGAKRQRRLRGDLDNIVLKALRKEPDERYASVAALEEDLRCHLEKLPVSARSPTWRYRVSRFVSRHRIGVAAASLAILGLIAATTFSIQQMGAAIESQRVAEAERTIAVDNLSRATLTAALAAVNGSDALEAKHLLESVEPGNRGWEWSLVESRLDQAVDVAVAPETVAVGLRDGRLLTVSRSGSIESWGDGRPVHSQQLPTAEILLARFSPDGSRVLTVVGGLLTLWSIEPGATVETMFQRPAEESPVDVVLSVDGRSFAAIGETSIMAWSERTGDVATWPLTRPPGLATMNANGTRVAVTVKSDRPSGYVVFDLLGNVIIQDDDSEVIGLSLSPDGAFLATSDFDRQIRLRNTETARVMRRFQGHLRTPDVLAFSGDGQQLVSTGSDETLRAWSMNDAARAVVLTGHRSPIRQIQVDAGGRYVASLADGGDARLWAIDGSLSTPDIEGDWARFSGNGSSIVTLEDSGTLRLYDSASREQYDSIVVSRVAANAFDLSRQNGMIAAANNHRLLLLDPSTLEETANVSIENSDIVDVTFSNGGDRVAIVDGHGLVSLVDTETREVVSIPGDDGVALFGSVEFSPDDSEFAITSASGVTIRNTSTTEIVRTLSLGAIEPLSLTYDPRGGSLATGWSDGMIRIVDAASGEIVTSFAPHPSAVEVLEYSPDGARLVSGANDASVWISNPETGQPLMALDGLGDAVQSLDFAPDGQRLIATAQDATVAVWETHPPRVLWNAAAELREERANAAKSIDAYFARSADRRVVANLIRGDSALTERARRAALQLTLEPSLPGDAPAGDPFDGYALEFAAYDSHVLVNNPERLRMTDAFTIETWINPTPFPGGATPLSLRMVFNKEGEYQIAIRPDGELLWVIADANGWLGWVETHYKVPFDRWTHIALVRDRAHVRFYINGIQVQEQPVSESIGDEHRSLNQLRIGGRQHTPSSFRGRVDEMRIWSDALTSRQIRAGLFARPDATAPSLLAAWSFDDGGGDVTRDSTANHDGVVVGATWVPTSREESDGRAAQD